MGTVQPSRLALSSLKMLESRVSLLMRQPMWIPALNRCFCWKDAAALHWRYLGSLHRFTGGSAPSSLPCESASRVPAIDAAQPI